MIFKILGSIIIVAAGVLAYLIVQDQPALKGITKSITSSKQECIQLTPAEQLIELIDSDFAQLEQTGQLPKQWKSIATIEYRMGSELARALLGKAKPGIQRVQNGSHYLEVEVLDLPDENNPGIILQASLFDIKSKNKIFEIGRTYTMNQLNRQQPEEKPAENPTGAAPAVMPPAQK